MLPDLLKPVCDLAAETLTQRDPAQIKLLQPVGRGLRIQTGIKEVQLATAVPIAMVHNL
jgi:hypothetical protein